ncbi:MAG: glycoside hydrolase family 9 protein [Bacteroidales bacterium]|nr:glycoside hydrolase family 9 protein [Bacteroidales bacterium]
MKNTIKALPIYLIAAILLLSVVIRPQEIISQRLSRDLNVDLLINQSGYLPGAGKNLVAPGKRNGKFEIVDLENQTIVFTGFLHPFSGDFGDYSVGDFTELKRTGRYFIKYDTLRSWPFAVSSSVYKPVMDMIVNYFSLQRCGSSTTGYLSPCHLDDGIRMDNGKHLDVTGGWHDASDLRKWLDATVYGMIGLSKTFELQNQPENNRVKILEELMWGNQYFLKMQEPQGYIMNYVGGDVQKHSDSNRWTNNDIEKEGGELKFVKPNTGTSTSDMLIFGSQDDRVIRTDPVGITGQYNFITSEAIMARITKTGNPDYSQKCLAAAKKCFEWCAEKTEDESPGTIGASIQASLELYKTTRQDIYKNFAVDQASKLKKLQVNSVGSELNGFFNTSSSDNQPYKNIWQGCLEFISVCDLIETFPLHEDAPVWKEMISGYANNYLAFISQKNSFGIIPFGLYTDKDPGGDRKVGSYWYRYFMQPDPEWWVGINSNIASAGIGLIKAAGILKDEKLKAVAQKQLDWIIGVNPFNSSTIEMVGHNQPKHFPGSTFLPDVPVLPGAVLNGLGGDIADQPQKGDGDWQISEYWTPMVAHTLWLMAEISAAK